MTRQIRVPATVDPGALRKRDAIAVKLGLLLESAGLIVPVRPPFLDAAESGALSAAAILDAYHNADLTIADDEFSATEAEAKIVGPKRFPPDSET